MKIVMSVDRANKSNSVNVANRKLFRGYLNNIKADYTLAKGVWEGAEEQSFIIRGNRTLLSFMASLAIDMFEQDAIIYISDDEVATLEERDDTRTQIGTWTEVSKEEAESNIGYTQVGLQYWICK